MQNFFISSYKVQQAQRKAPFSVLLRFCILTLLLWGLSDVGLLQLQAQSCPEVRVSQKYTIAYGTVAIEGMNAPVGTVVEARSPRGDVVGCRVIDIAGALRTTKIYGEETVAGVTVPGMRTGETIRFYLNGVLAASEPQLQWVDDWMVGGRHSIALFAQSAPTFTPIATPTSIPSTVTSTMTPTLIPTATATNTPVPPTNTLTATATDTPVPPMHTATSTNTSVPIATATTSTPAPPTVTPSNTHTPTEPAIPTVTATPTDPATPTYTVTSTPTDLPTVMPTRVTPTAIPTHTVTVATAPPTTTQTTRPTATYTATFTTTPTPTATSTPLQTPTDTLIPTPIDTLSALPDLSLSRKVASSTNVDYFQQVDYTIILHNTGGLAQVQITDTLPVLLTYLPDTLSSTAGNVIYSAIYQAVLWSGFIEPGATVTITFGMSGPYPILAHDTRIENRVLIDDGVHEPFGRAVTIIANPWPTATPTAASTVTHTPTATPTPTSTATNTPSTVPTAAATPSFTNTPTPSSVLTPIETVTYTPTFTATPTEIPIPTDIPSHTPAVTPTETPSHTPAATPTAIATLATAIPTNTPTATPIVVRIIPETGGTVTYTNTAESRLTIHVPANAVTETLDLVLQVSPPSNIPPGFAFSGQSFTLDAFRNDTRLETYTFSKPITITITYREDAIGAMPEANLQLFLFDVRQEQWSDVKSSCTPESTYHRDATENTLSVAVCHLTEFALFAIPQQLYLPYVQR